MWFDRQGEIAAVMEFQSELLGALGINQSTEIAVLELEAPRVPFCADLAGWLMSMPLGADGLQPKRGRNLRRCFG